MLTESHIENALKTFPKAKRMAVENFCFSAPDDKRANEVNLKADAASYPWNSDTVNAIRVVLRAEGKL